MGLQTYFEEFNKNIKMDFEERSELAEKRDILLKKLRANDELPSFKEFNQGSYGMFTGVKPLENKDYDIDVGLKFDVNVSDYNPLDLKVKIRDILKNHTEYGAEIKKPCVTVSYKKDGELAYHVDLVAYAYEDKDNKESQMYLSRGEEFSKDENKYWEESEPVKLKDDIMDKFEEEAQRNQYRRIIRYMKRWKNIEFGSSGNAEPPGIGITLLAYKKFEPQKYDWLEGKYIYDDLEALINFVEAVKNMFVYERYSEDRGENLYRIKLNLHVKPNTDVFSKMTDIQMTEFKKKVESLLCDLKEVRNEAELVKQCELLNKIFGEDFPIPNKKETAKVQQRNFTPNSSSGKGIF